MLKKVIIAVIAIGAVFFLAGCGMQSSSDPAPIVTKTVIQEAPAAPAPAPVTSSEDDYIMYIQSVRPDMVSTYGESSLISVGYSFCEFVRSGGTITQYGEIAISSGITTNEAAAIGAAAITAFCPDMQYIVD